MVDSPRATGTFASLGALTDAGSHRVAGALLALTPVLLLAALAGFFSTAPAGGAAESAAVLSVGWTLLWVLVTAAYVAFAVGSFAVIHGRVSGLTGRLLGTVPLLLIPLVLVALGVATYATRSLVRSEAEQAVADEQLPLVLSVMEATTDGVVLSLGALFGAVLLVLGYVMTRQSSRWRIVGFLGLLLGANCLLTNLGILLTTGEPVVGTIAVVAASLWLVPTGWFVARNPARSGS